MKTKTVNILSLSCTMFIPPSSRASDDHTRLEHEPCITQDKDRNKDKRYNMLTLRLKRGRGEYKRYFGIDWSEGDKNMTRKDTTRHDKTRQTATRTTRRDSLTLTLNVALTLTLTLNVTHPKPNPNTNPNPNTQHPTPNTQNPESNLWRQKSRRRH